MFTIDNLPEILLKRFLVEFSAGDYLFRQGEKGNTMYFILSGSIQLSHRLENTERLVGHMESGEFLGEKAILEDVPYRRACSALATSNLQTLEFSAGDLKVIQSRVPDFSLKILSMVSERLDKANHLISVLQLNRETDRLVHFLLYEAKFFGVRASQGTEIQLSCRTISEGCNVEEQLVSEALSYLVNQKILLKSLNGYIIPDENSLLGFLTRLYERVAA